MRCYNELTPEEQAKAKEKCLVSLLEQIIEGSLRFSDEKNQDDLQARIDAACQKAEDMKTPWFAHEYILDTCREDLEAMAQCDAEDALYPSEDERIIRLG